MEHYSTSGKFPAALGSYLDSVVECKTDVAKTVLIGLIVGFSVLGLLGTVYYVCKVPPKRRGMKMHQDVEFRAMEVAKRI